MTRFSASWVLQSLSRAAALTLTFALTSAAAHAITIVHTNDVLGELEPCGCRTNPLGGMARKANLLAKLADKEIIQLDAGDLLFPSTELPEALKKQSLLQAKYLLQSMDLIHHDAVVPGEKDFALGLDAFKKLIKGTKVKFIAANLKDRHGKNFLPPHLLIRRKDENGKTVTVAVIGIVGDQLTWPKDVKATSALKAAREEVKALHGKADYLVLLTHEGLEADEALAKAVPGVDYIIGAHTQSFLQTPITVESENQPKKGGTNLKLGTTLFQSSFRNQYIGLIPVKRPFNADDYKLVALDPGYDSPEGKPSAMDTLVKDFKSAIAELNTREAAEMEQTHASSGHKFHTFPRCAECHIKQFDFWRKTAHARALEPLVKAQQSANKECLSCHTVGLGDPQGYQAVTQLAEIKKGSETETLTTDALDRYLKAMADASSIDTPVKLTEQSEPQPLKQSLNSLVKSYSPVQCENCHQPGEDHPFSGTYTKAVDTQKTCLKCHSTERAPEWYKDNHPDWKTIEAKRAKVTCPAGDLTVE